MFRTYGAFLSQKNSGSLMLLYGDFYQKKLNFSQIFSNIIVKKIDKKNQKIFFYQFAQLLLV